MRIPFVRKSQEPAPPASADRTLGMIPVATIDRMVGAPHISLADVIGRRTPIRWFEGVAILSALSERLRVDEHTDSPVPDLTETFITPDGHLEVPSRHSAHGGVQALARILHVLLAGEQVPPPLRLFISKWIESAGPHPIKDFAEGLAYFARPDGAALVRAVYERYLTMPELPAGAVIPKPPIDPPKESPRERRRIPRWVAVAAVVVACIGGVLVVWALAENSSEASGSALSRVVADGRRALDAAREELAQRFGIGTSSTPDAPKQATTTAPVPGPRPRSRSIVPPPAAEIPIVPIPLARQSFDLDQRPFVVRPPETAVSGSVSGDDATEREAVDAPSFLTVYTTTDFDVEPPQMVYPHLPRVEHTGPDINSMEVVITEEGSVEHVRLISAARRMTDMMLLSGAKNWRFAPALRDGQPVRYRITINWMATQ
jgi:hypothetical protein